MDAPARPAGAFRGYFKGRPRLQAREGASVAGETELRVAGGAVTLKLLVGGERGLPLEALRADACCSAYGELLASLLLGRFSAEGPHARDVEHAAEEYVERVYREEAASLTRLFGEASHRVTMPAFTPLLVRMARLCRLYPWLKLVYSAVLTANPQALVAAGLRAARRLGLELKGLRARLAPLGERVATQLRLPASLARAVIDVSLVHQLVTPQLIAEGLSARPHPLLRDPLAGVRVGDAPVAVKLVRFEDQLYAITGVARAIAAVKRIGVSAARKVAAGSFVTAVVKDYRSPIAAKWLVAAILTLHLPRPKLSARRRLTTEVEYSYKLADLGFKVHEPILVDPRRLRAAFRYVEGTDLASLLKRSSVPPQYRDLGLLLAELHRKGVSLWDTNPSNFVVDRVGSLVLVDVEQARPLRSVEEAAWDLVMGVYYSAIYSPRDTPSRAKMVAEAYLDAGGERRVVEEAAKPRYMLPFVMAVAPNVLEKARRALLHALHGGLTSKDF